MKDIRELYLTELSPVELDNTNGGIWFVAYALIAASIAVPFYAGWKAYGG
jgi:hypothetical protein